MSATSPHVAFAHALGGTSHPALFSRLEKRLLVATAVLAFTLPVGFTIASLQGSSFSFPSSSLVGEMHASTQLASVTQDEESLAQYFVNRAQALLTSPDVTYVQQQEATLLLEQAHSLLQNADTTRPLVASLQQQVMSLQLQGQQLANGSTTTPSVQRIAADAPAPQVTTVAAAAKSNSHQDTVTFAAGTTSLWVPYKKLTETSQIYVVPTTRTNDVIYVKSKEVGSGFLLETTAAPASDISLTWYDIAE